MAINFGNNFISLINLLAGVIVGLIVSFLGYFVKKCWEKPRLKLSKGETAFGTKTNNHTIKVSNCGRSAAIDCIGELTLNIEESDVISEGSEAKDYCIHKGNFRKIEDEGLSWSYKDNPDKIMINPCASKKLDFFESPTGTLDHINVVSEFGLSNDKKKYRVKLKPGKYKGEIRVSGANAKLVKMKVEIFVDSGKVNFKLLYHFSSWHGRRDQ